MSEFFTPGPWQWMGNNHGLYLATTHSGRRYVMGFHRWGMQKAQPCFQERRRMVNAEHLVKFEVGDGLARGFKQGLADDSVYRYDVKSIDNPDARLIAAAPELLSALRQLHLKTVVGTDAERHAALEQAWAAITKATEPSPTLAVVGVAG